MSPAIVLEEKVRPAALLCVMPFILWFLVTSFLPDTHTPKPVIFDIPVEGIDVLLLFAALASFGGWLVAGQSPAHCRKWTMSLPLWFLSIVAFAAVSTLWSGMDTFNTRAMLYSLCFAAAAFILPFSVIASLPRGQVRSLTWAIAFALAVVSAVYCVVTFFGLSVRSELGHFYTYGFGIERLKGPLFEPSTGHMILLPAAAVLLQDWLDDDVPGHGLANAFGLAVLSISMIGLGSRFALVVTAVFLLAIAVTARGARGRRIVGVAVLGVALSVGVVFQYASAERLTIFDPGRASTYATAFNIVNQRGSAVDLRGSGYGSIWPWYLRDWEFGERIVRGQGAMSTDYGTMLIHPHSVFLLLVVELGVVGLLFFGKLWIVLGRVVIQSVSRRENSLAAIGMACASLGMLADTILFKNPRLSAVWWFFLLATLAVRKPRLQHDHTV